MPVLDFSFDTSEIEALDPKLAAVASGEAIGRGAVRAVNEVLDRTYDTARRRMNAGINLDDPYISRKLTVTHATTVPQGKITAAGDLTLLGRYNPKILLKPVKNPARSKGDPSRGIPPGLKASGVSVQVTRGLTKPIAGGFIVSLRNENGLGVFTRDGKKIRQRYGPSVYQLFRATIDVISPEIQDDLESTVGDAIALEVQRAFE